MPDHHCSAWAIMQIMLAEAYSIAALQENASGSYSTCSTWPSTNLHLRPLNSNCEKGRIRTCPAVSKAIRQVKTSPSASALGKTLGGALANKRKHGRSPTCCRPGDSNSSSSLWPSPWRSQCLIGILGRWILLGEDVVFLEAMVA